MTMKRRQVGLAGEKEARNYLESKGYEIIETNYRCPLGEIDIIAREQETIVFIEVRTRTGLAFGGPEESINFKKAHQMRRLAQYYLKTISVNERPCRIDLVAVRLKKNDLNLEHLNHLKGILAG